MKKILITILFMLAAIGAYGQNKFKYQVQALGGLSIGNTADTTKIDSAIYTLGVLKLYRGSAEISVNWNTAYTDRLKWDGGATDLVAATGRTSLGGTTVGQAFFTLTNPTAITFPRINADNTVTALSAANTLTAIGGANTALSNLASVAINTNLLPTAAGTIDLGSVTYPFDDVNLDTASAINFHNGDVTITHSDGVLTVGGGNLALGSNNLTLTGSISTASSIAASGLVSTGAIRIGTDESSSNIDSVKVIGTTYQPYDGATALAPAIPASAEAGLSVYAKLLVDTTGIFVFGAGSGAAADSTLFAKGAKAFGSFYNYTDTLYAVNFNVLYITSGDSLTFNCFWGNRMTGVAADSLFNVHQHVGVNQNLLTPYAAHNKIPPDKDVWIELNSDQITGYRPKQFEIQLNGYIIRDH